MSVFRAVTRNYRGLPKAIWTLFLSETVMATGSFVYPFLAFVLTRHFRMSEQRVGCVMAVSAVVSLLGTVVGGVLADGISKKRVLVGAMTLSALAYAVVPLVHSGFVVSMLIVLGLGFMAATKPAFDAIVSELTVRDNRRAAFSLLYAAVNIGFAAGPILASVLFAHHFMWLFLGDAAATVVSALLIVFLVRYKEKRHTTIETSSLQLTKLGRQLRELSPTLKEHPSIVPTVLIYLLNMALYAQIFFALPLLMSRKFGSFGPRGYGLVMTVNALGVVLLTPVVTSVTKRFSSGACLAFGGILFAIGLGGYGVVKTMVGVTALAIIWTLGELLTVANARVYVADLAPKAQRGRLGALLEVAHELGFGIGPAVAGYFIAHRGVAELWPFLACVGVFTAATMGLVEWQRVISTTMVSSKSKVAS